MLHPAKNTLLLLLILLLTKMATGQQVEYRVTHYDETTGLESNVINAMLQDSRGYLWFGTADGLCRYDGYNFKTFRKKNGDSNSLPGNYISKLTEDKDGKIWIGLLKDGISSYDPATGTFRNYDVKNIDPEKPLAMAVTMLFSDKENNIWAGLAQKGLVKLNRQTGKFSQYNIIADTSTFYSKEFRAAYNNVYAMYEAGNGTNWLATHDGLYKFSTRTRQMTPVRAKPLQKEIPGKIMNNTIRDDLFNSIAADKNGLWMGSWAGGLSNFNFATKQWGNYKFSTRNNNTATTNIISGIKPKNENELWVSSLDKGFGIFNKTTLRFSFFSDSVANGIPSSSCSAIMLDKQNNVWISCSDGLFKIKQTEKTFIHVPMDVKASDNGSFYTITMMLEDRAGKYLFTGTAFADGLHITNKKTNTTKAVSFAVMQNEESALMVNDIMEDSHHIIWLLTRDYIYQCDPQKNKLISLPQPPAYMNGSRSNFFTVIKEDKLGQIWISSARNGVFCYNPAERKYKHFYSEPATKNSLPSNVITGLAVDFRGRVWVGGTRGCFGYFETPGGNFINLDQNGEQSLHTSDNRVLTLYADNDGNIMAGTDAGLYCYNTHDTRPKLRKIYNYDNGLKGDIVTGIQEDTKGDIWCTTGSALCKINRQTGSVIAFKKQDGIDKVNLLNGLFLYQSGQMAAFTVKGSYVFDPASFLKKEANIPTTITSFKIDDKEQYFDNKISTKLKLVVPAGTNIISFEFAALDFDRPDKEQYTYKLEGFDKDWVMAGPRRYAGYANLPGGDYVFRVRASTSDDNNMGPVALLSIHIIQPFYKTWWFIATICLLVVYAAYMFYRFKLKKQRQIYVLETKAQNLEKEKVLAMYEGLKQQLNPHFLFNSLTSLSSLIQYNQKKAGEFLDGLSKLYRYILKSRDNETVPLIDEIKFVQTFVHLQQTRFEKGLTVNIDVPSDVDYCKITPATLQNLVENAIKHNIIDEESPLVIDIYTEEDYIVVRNNLQKKNFVETSNKQGLASLISLYHYLSRKPIIITEENNFFFIKIPLI